MKDLMKEKGKEALRLLVSKKPPPPGRGSVTLPLGLILPLFLTGAHLDKQSMGAQPNETDP